MEIIIGMVCLLLNGTLYAIYKLHQQMIHNRLSPTRNYHLLNNDTYTLKEPMHSSIHLVRVPVTVYTTLIC